jgi:hypothetical protein
MIKEACESQTARDRFSGTLLYKEVIDGIQDESPRVRTSVKILLDRIDNEQLFKYVFTGVLRNVFLIELANKEVKSTKFTVRWTEDQGPWAEWLGPKDPRFATYEECYKIFTALLEDLTQSFSEDKVELFKTFYNYKLLAYELPIDYEQVPTQPDQHIHSEANIVWFWDDEYRQIVKLRKHLLDKQTNPQAPLFETILKDKLKVKTYLTDRALTGAYKTNREKRWEALPKSPQFAKRRECLQVEKELVEQLVRFADFPAELKEELQRKSLVAVSPELYRCPVTLDILSFKDLQAEVENPQHGKAYFQVAHLNPLKAGEGSQFRHTPANIGWITADGNRIQGDLTLEETRALLRRITANYTSLGK